jgi:hypothetical protein
MKTIKKWKNIRGWNDEQGRKRDYNDEGSKNIIEDHINKEKNNK